MSEYQVIGSGDVVVGKFTVFGAGVKFIFKKPGVISFGDYVTVGDGVKVVIDGGNVFIDDWSTVHSNTLIISKKGIKIGQHCWFGQNNIIDGTGGLIIGNGVRVGMYSHIWTHVAAGELIEGCTLFSEKPVYIDDDVWLVGSCTIGSGVKIGRRAICMNGSYVTKSVADNTVVAGSPAKPRVGLKFYKIKTIEEKYAMMQEWLLDFCRGSIKIYCDDISRPNCTIIRDWREQEVFIFKYSYDYIGYSLIDGQSKFCIENKKYSKSFTDLEAELIRYLSGNKARFLK
jgi:acetyltransferase-like isoleucine patch superfamily enzyme